ncbi:unnamed protein product, partial [Aureobasidium uvarum]
ILIRPNITPARPAEAGRTTAAAPAEELDEADEEAIKRVAVESPVEADEPLVLNELEVLSWVEEIAELDAESEEVALPLTMPPINPVVGKSLVDFDIELEIELGTGTIPVAVAAAEEMKSKAAETREDSAARLTEA